MKKLLLKTFFLSSTVFSTMAFANESAKTENTQYSEVITGYADRTKQITDGETTKTPIIWGGLRINDNNDYWELGYKKLTTNAQNTDYSLTSIYSRNVIQPDSIQYMVELGAITVEHMGKTLQGHSFNTAIDLKYSNYVQPFVQGKYLRYGQDKYMSGLFGLKIQYITDAKNTYYFKVAKEKDLNKKDTQNENKPDIIQYDIGTKMPISKIFYMDFDYSVRSNKNENEKTLSIQLKLNYKNIN